VPCSSPLVLALNIEVVAPTVLLGEITAYAAIECTAIGISDGEKR
jgi:hypothetical protein